MTDPVAIYLAKEDVVLAARKLRLGTGTLDELVAKVDALNAELAKRPSGGEEAA